MIKSKLIICNAVLLLIASKIFSQNDSYNSFKIPLNETSKQVNFCFSDLYGPWQLDLYRYEETVESGTSYLFLLPANQSSTGLKDSGLPNVIPCLLVKKKENIYFIANTSKDFNFLESNKSNKIFFPKDTFLLQLNDKYYNFCLTITDTSEYSDQSLRNFPNSDSVYGHKKTAAKIHLNVEFLNKKTGSFIADGKPLWLTSIDGNFNGNYNDVGIDRIGIRSKKNAEVFDIGFVAYKENIEFQLNDTTTIFINKITCNGDTAEAEKLQPFSSFKFNGRDFFSELKIVDTMPDFTFQLFNGNKKELKKLFGNKEYILIYQWGLWCAGCYQETDYLLINYPALSEHMNIVGFNYKDKDFNKVKDYIEMKKIPWVMAKSNLSIYENIFRRMGFPAAILIRKDFTIQKYFSGTDYLNFFIKSEKPNTLITK